MATGDTVATIPINAFTPDSAGAHVGPFDMSVDGVVMAAAFPRSKDTAIYAAVRLDKLAAFSTGATIKMLISDDPLNSCANQPVVIGATLGQLGASTSYYAAGTSALGTEVTATVVTPATSGKTLQVSIALTAIGQAAADTFALLRIRRLGTNTSDTATGRLLLLGSVSILDT